MNSFESWEIDAELEKLKAQMRNPQTQANFTDTKYTPPKNPHKTKREQEIDAELEQLKAQMRAPQSNANTKSTSSADDKNKIFYEILEIKSGASQKEVKQAYLRLAKKWHPDIFFREPKLQLQAQEKFKRINEAYKKLYTC